jgi:hypothetical protein
MDGTVVRRGGPADFGTAGEVWRAANEARLEGRAPPPPVQVERLHAAVRDPASFLFVADEGGVSGMVVSVQGPADHGAGPPIEDLCHVGACLSRPSAGARASAEKWSRLCSPRRAPAATTARGSGPTPTTSAPNASTKTTVFRRTGREKQDDLGETIARYARRL